MFEFKITQETYRRTIFQPEQNFEQSESEPQAEESETIFQFPHKLVVDLPHLDRAIARGKQRQKTQGRESQWVGRWLDLAERLKKNETVRLAPPPALEEIDGLIGKYPHLSNAIRIVKDFSEISRFAESPSSLPPLLLYGPPGAGKTAFVLDLAKILGVPFRLVNAASLTHTFILGGLDPSWTSSKEGTILNLLLEGSGNPVMVLDEIDKAAKGTTGEITGSVSIQDYLLNALETLTSRKFVDEFLMAAYPVDASKIQWIFTANDLNKLSKPLLSRMTVISVREPTKEELREVIIPSLYRDILEEYGLSGKVPEILPEEVILSLSGTPREARRRILRLLAGFARERKFKVLNDPEITENRRQIGFNVGG